MWGAGPPATWAFAIFLASDMLFLRLFPGGFGVFAFSQCGPLTMVMVKRGWPYHTMVMVADHAHVQRWPIRREQ